MNLTIRYFASLREQRGLNEETWSTSASTLGELYEELRQKHGFTLGSELVRPAVDGEFAEMTDPVADGAEVVFVPPVAGG